MIKEKFFAELNKPQLEATLNDINSCTKIVAGAGCGKTKVIASRYLKLVLDMQENKIEDPLSKILVITFTDKAAGEMKERLQSIVGDVSELWVSTIHSMCVRILRRDIEKLGYEKNFLPSLPNSTPNSTYEWLMRSSRGYLSPATGV